MNVTDMLLVLVGVGAFMVAFGLALVGVARLVTRFDSAPEPSNRGTLTLFPDGTVVLGVPTDVEMSDHNVAQVREALAAWTAKRGPLIVPWPVDVRDLRRSS